MSFDVPRVPPRDAAAWAVAPGSAFASRTVRRSISVAVVGCGYWGAKHVRVLSSLKDVAEVVVVDPDERARTNIGAAFPGIILNSSLDRALDRVDAVVVATPPDQHGAVARQALRAGKHLLVEKPLANSLDEARDLVEEAQRYGLTLMVGHTFLFNPAVRELRQRMETGDLGDILYIHSARLNLGLYRRDVNVVWDLAPHDISIMNFLLGTTPQEVRAWGSANLSKEVTDLAYFQLEYPDRGVTCYGHVSWLDPRKVRQVTVVGTRKMAVYDDLAEEKLRIFDRGVDRSVDDSNPLHQMPVSYRYGDIVAPHIAFSEPLLLEDQHFVHCVRTGAKPSSDGAAGLAVVSVLHAIDHSLKTGGPAGIAVDTPHSGRVQTPEVVG